PGFDTALASVLTYYSPAAIGSGLGYECDTTFTDLDSDLVGTCLDVNDKDSRMSVKAKANASGTHPIPEHFCDLYDNNGDGVIDGTTNSSNNFGGATCGPDLKRQTQPNLLQGDANGAVNLVTGNFQRTEIDAVLQGPFGPLVFARTYNSRADQ